MSDGESYDSDSAETMVYYITDYIAKSRLKTHVAYAALQVAVKKCENVELLARTWEPLPELARESGPVHFDWPKMLGYLDRPEQGGGHHKLSRSPYGNSTIFVMFLCIIVIYIQSLRVK